MGKRTKKYTGDKTDVTALVKYAQDLEAEILRLRAQLIEIRDRAPVMGRTWASSIAAIYLESSTHHH